MDEQNEKIIWFIDNDEYQLQQYRRHLENGISSVLGDDTELIIREYPARPHKDNYLDILDNPSTVAIMIDQVLKDKGGVDHTGIELAQYLRSLNNILPIYILTNYPSGDEYSEGEWSVEGILDKADLIDSARVKVVINRLSRRINIYEDVYGQREARFRGLLKKSLHEDLSDSEQKELDELEFERSAATLARERAEQATPDKLDEVLDQLQDLRQMFNDLDQIDED